MADNRGLLGDSWAFTEALGDGVWDAGTGMVEGLGDLAKGGYELATDANARESAWETTKQLADAAADYGKSVIENPGEAYRYARDGTLAAYDRFEQAKDLAAAEGRSAEFFGDMAGGALFEVGSILVPVGLVAKAGKLGKVASVAEDVADAAKATKKVENAEDVFGATQKAKAASVNPAIKEFDDKVSPVQRCPVADVGVKNIDDGVESFSTNTAYDGKLYPDKKVNQLVQYLDKRGVSVMETKGNPSFTGNWDGSGVMKLPANATELQVKHELSHFIDFKNQIKQAPTTRAGVQKYVDKGRLGREQTVLDGLQNNRVWDQLNDAERSFSVDYVKRLRIEAGQ
jgi:hypothetical protein